MTARTRLHAATHLDEGAGRSRPGDRARPRPGWQLMAGRHRRPPPPWLIAVIGAGALALIAASAARLAVADSPLAASVVPVAPAVERPAVTPDVPAAPAGAGPLTIPTIGAPDPWDPGKGPVLVDARPLVARSSAPPARVTPPVVRPAPPPPAAPAEPAPSVVVEPDVDEPPVGLPAVIEKEPPVDEELVIPVDVEPPADVDVPAVDASEPEPPEVQP